MWTEFAVALHAFMFCVKRVRLRHSQGRDMYILGIIILARIDRSIRAKGQTAPTTITVIIKRIAIVARLPSHAQVGYSIPILKMLMLLN